MKIITICGSYKFKKEMISIAERQTLQGNCVLMPNELTKRKEEYTEQEILLIEKMHKEKIKVSDAILVVNVDNYIGNSTKQEIEYAKSLNKEIIYYTDLMKENDSMISYCKFKELFEVLDANRAPEIEIFFHNRKDNYIIVKHIDHVTFSREGKEVAKDEVIKFQSLDELYNNKTIDDICLKEEWNNIDDILLDFTFSLIEDKKEIYNIYGIVL